VKKGNYKLGDIKQPMVGGGTLPFPNPRGEKTGGFSELQKQAPASTGGTSSLRERVQAVKTNTRGTGGLITENDFGGGGIFIKIF